jgi:hypothetical protein
LPSEPGERYFSPPGVVVLDSVGITLYQGTKKEKQIDVRSVVLADQRMAKEMGVEASE